MIQSFEEKKKEYRTRMNSLIGIVIILSYVSAGFIVFAALTRMNLFSVFIILSGIIGLSYCSSLIVVMIQKELASINEFETYYMENKKLDEELIKAQIELGTKYYEAQIKEDKKHANHKNK